MKPSRIVLLCATDRGVRFVQRTFALCPKCEFVVCTFPEEPWEPPFVARLEDVVKTSRQRMIITRQFGPEHLFEDGSCDLILAVNWRYMVPSEVFGRAVKGAYVFHDSLLPRYRGFSPTTWAIINGERETGATLFEMTDVVDRGGIVDQISVAIGGEEYVDSVIERVTQSYLQLLERNISHLLSGTIMPRIQDEDEATYACKRIPEDNRINWEGPAQCVFNLVRACSVPYPGAYCFWQGKRITVWTCDAPCQERRYIGIVPGRVVERLPNKGVRVLANDYSLLLRKVQLDGGPVVLADEVFKSLAHSLT